MKIITLLENTTSNQDLTPKHGLSLYIETDNKTILFDTGPDNSFIENAKKLNIDLANVDIVFISHGHYDHGGGIPGFQKINNKARIILSGSAMDSFYIKSLGTYRHIGLPKDEIDIGQCDFISQDKQIDGNIHIFTRFNKTGFIPQGNLSLKVKNSQGKKVGDDFSHEIAVLIRQGDTNILFTGCSHSGVGNMVETVLNRTGFGRIDMVMGGFHLFNPAKQETESKERIQQLAKELSAYPDTKFYTGHCTGQEAFGRLKELMKERIFEFKTGTRIIV